MRRKTLGTVMTLAVAANLILFARCASVSSGGKDQSKDGEQGKCIAYSLSGKAQLKDYEQEKCMAVSSGRNIAYWIDGERSTPGCNWHLEHVKCEKGFCLYRCRETEALWHLSLFNEQGNVRVVMEKDIGNDTTFPQKNIFK